MLHLIDTGFKVIFVFTLGTNSYFLDWLVWMVVFAVRKPTYSGLVDVQDGLLKTVSVTASRFWARDYCLVSTVGLEEAGGC